MIVVRFKQMMEKYYSDEIVARFDDMDKALSYVKMLYENIDKIQITIVNEKESEE